VFGMAVGLKRDPIVILCFDGEALLEFVNGPSYEAEMASIFSQIALSKLTVDQGIPPASDSWVFSNIVEPVVLSQGGPDWDKPLASEIKRHFWRAERLKEQPVIVAHSENTFDGSGVKRLLSNKFEFDKKSVEENLPKDKNGKISKGYLRLALDGVSPSAGLPPFGAIEE
ncbi:hypothetical protein S83_006963, partial [Arachis hypogaea]